MNVEKILDNIVKYRKDKGYSHESMANSLDIAQATYFKIESGKTELSLRRLIQISTVLEIEIDRLLGIDAKQNINNVNDSAVGIQNIETQNNQTKEAYEQHIQSLKDEISYLRKIVSGNQ